MTVKIGTPPFTSTTISVIFPPIIILLPSKYLHNIFVILTPTHDICSGTDLRSFYRQSDREFFQVIRQWLVFSKWFQSLCESLFGIHK